MGSGETQKDPLSLSSDCVALVLLLTSSEARRALDLRLESDSRLLGRKGRAVRDGSAATVCGVLDATFEVDSQPDARDGSCSSARLRSERRFLFEVLGRV